MVTATRRKPRLRRPRISAALLRELVVDLFGLVAVGLIVCGVWQWVHWLAPIVAGVLILAALFVLERGEVTE